MTMRNGMKMLLVCTAVATLGLVGCGKSEDSTSGDNTIGYDGGAGADAGNNGTLNKAKGLAENAVKVAYNTTCPVSGEAVAADSTVDFNGQTVGFCCGDCVDKWEGMDDAARTAMLAKMDGDG